MTIIDQPHNSTTGDKLIGRLTENSDYRGWFFYIVVAYVKRSGVSRLKQAIENFRTKGGKVIATVGVDQKNTSIQGLKMLFEVVDDLYVYHSESPYQTFHPKVYLLTNDKQKAYLFIGSSNLTGGGLFTNYEAVEEIIYELEESRTAYNDIFKMVNRYRNTQSPCCLKVDDKLLDSLIKLEYLANEEVKIGVSTVRTGEGGEQSRAKRLFGVEQFRPPPVRILTVGDPGVKEKDIPKVLFSGGGFWKKLSENDVSLTSSPGQIIIPIRFLLLFPEFSTWQIMKNNARQSDVYFNVIFTSAAGVRSRIDHVRSIHYVPAPNHPRPNQELRFTFRNQNILDELNTDDVLVFRRTDNPDIWFDITHLLKGTTKLDGISFLEGRYNAIGS